MDLPDKTAAVARMQAYIIAHLDENITLAALCGVARYSKYHTVRIFKELTNHTPFEYIRALRLTKAANTLRDSGDQVTRIALESGFESHDGFTRAFVRQFGVTPQKYQRETPAVRWFVHYPIESYYRISKDAKQMEKEAISGVVTVTAVERPARKLILFRSVKADDYMSYCEEMGCEWEGLFNSIAEKFDDAALLTLPPNLMRPGTGNTASGVEVPLDYAKPIPAGYEMIDLPPCTMLYFLGMPYADENDFCLAIDTVWEALDAYDPIPFGWQYEDALAPRFNFGTSAKRGARMAVPVMKRV